MPQTRICVGEITGAHGVRGLVRVRSFTAEPSDVAAYGPLATEDGSRRITLRLCGVQRGQFLAEIDGVRDRDQAQALAGTLLYVDRDRLPPPDEDEFYFADLIGLRAEAEDGPSLGTVAAVHEFGAGPVLEIADGPRRTLLPFTRAVVPVVDIAGGRLVVALPDEVEVRDLGDGAS